MKKVLLEAINSIRIINANLKLKDRSHKMSRQMTNSEQIIWFNVFPKRQLLGYKFTKQKIIFSYILDFYYSELLLGVEIDGESHSSRLEYNSERTRFINSIGIKIIRITNDDVKANLGGVRQYLEETVFQYSKNKR